MVLSISNALLVTSHMTEGPLIYSANPQTDRQNQPTDNNNQSPSSQPQQQQGTKSIFRWQLGRQTEPTHRMTCRQKMVWIRWVYSEGWVRYSLGCCIQSNKNDKKKSSPLETATPHCPPAHWDPEVSQTDALAVFFSWWRVLRSIWRQCKNHHRPLWNGGEGVWVRKIRG